MPKQPWHPYAPDQAFGRQAARDEELLDTVLNGLDGRRPLPPRAGNKARPPGGEPRRMTGPGLDGRTFGWLGHNEGGPVTTAVALDAAARLREDVHG
jgi:hypothetical protein